MAATSAAMTKEKLCSDVTAESNPVFSLVAEEQRRKTLDGATWASCTGAGQSNYTERSVLQAIDLIKAIAVA